MFLAIDEQYYKLTNIIFPALDYDRLLSNPPYDNKGKVKQGEWNTIIKQAKEIYSNALGQVNSNTKELTEGKKKKFIEISQIMADRQKAKIEGYKYDDELWRSKLGQL